MQQVTVGSKYQIVIPKEVREKVPGLRPGSKVGIYINEGVVVIKIEPKNWIKETQGIAKEAWKGINTTKYLEDLRNEWDQKS